MRLSLFLVLVVATFAVLVSAEKTTTARRLKRADDLTAHEEERNILATTVSGLASGAEKFLSPALLAKLPNALRKNPAAVNKVDDTAAGAVRQRLRTPLSLPRWRMRLRRTLRL
uniref:Avh288 n=1 Tax=Phytophthora sojae TaxID=67593 RepID=G1FSM2_PHYSO|nr:Avh288 [Phytophthora sojae]